VVTAQGNSDIWLPEDPRLKESHVLHIERLGIGITHGLNYPEHSWRTLENAMEAEFADPVDVFVFGASHNTG
jgi:predicted phosphodiesterase